MAMKFYLCFLPLCLLLVLDIFPSCDGQFSNRREQQRMVQGPRPNPRNNQRHMPRGYNQNGGTCLVRGQDFRVGVKMVIDCELCTCLANGSTQCNPLNCMRCNRYPSLRTHPCCTQCRKMRGQPGAVITQACHASSAIIHLTRDDPICQQYLADLDNMHKVTLKISSEEDLRKLSETLSQNDIDHKLWIEQPEDIATCLATKPCAKETLQKYFKKLKLYR